MKSRLTLSADAVLQALIMMSSSIRLSLTSPPPVCTMYTSSPLTLSPTSTHVSRFANFLVTTLPGSIPSLSQILLVRSLCELPLNTFMLGILGRNSWTPGFGGVTSEMLRLMMDSADDLGSGCWVRTVWCDQGPEEAGRLTVRHQVDSLVLPRVYWTITSWLENWKLGKTICQM